MKVLQFSVALILCVGLLPEARGRFLRGGDGGGDGDGDGCAEGVPMVACAADPCLGQTCSVAGAVCKPNNCGVCKAEWFIGEALLVTAC